MPEFEWDSPSPEGAAAMLAACPVPWWVSGGWAIDLFLGQRTREHADLDLGCFRDELPGFLSCFESWDLREARSGTLHPLPPGQAPRADTTSLWMRPAAEGPWTLEVLPEHRDRGTWSYRRDRRVRREADTLTSRTRAGFEALRPEIQLLYKSKAPRPRDEADFARAAPRLSASARDWLRAALVTSAPGHPWATRLEEGVD